MSGKPGGRTVALAAVLVVSGAAFVLLGILLLGSAGRETTPARPATAQPPIASAVPSATEPILPPPPTITVVVTGVPSAGTPAHTLSPQPTDMPPATPTGSATPVPFPFRTAVAEAGLYTQRQRLGVCGSGSLVSADSSPGSRAGLSDRLGFGWYLDWGVHPDAFRSKDVEYVPMIRLPEGVPHPGAEELRAAVRALPGALWLIGNEPDVRWQDNVPPEAYAQAYHDLYTQLKDLDPTCQVAIGGVSQPTPLRLRYLDRILEAYQTRYGEPMPVDVWNVHNFVLREERGSWGVDIPPGMPEETGQLREIADHDDLAIFRQQIVDFRRWMKERGQQDKPLIVSEYGILMPTDYGFPPEQVEQFMMATFEFFESAVDPDLGYPADGHRLVQRWSWFSLADERYPTGNLLWPDGAPTPLGDAFTRYAHQIR